MQYVLIGLLKLAFSLSKIEKFFPPIHIGKKFVKIRLIAFCRFKRSKENQAIFRNVFLYFNNARIFLRICYYCILYNKFYFITYENLFWHNRLWYLLSDKSVKITNENIMHLGQCFYVLTMQYS